MPTAEIWHTGIVALLFALIFFTGGPLRPLYRLLHDRRGVISFMAGMSTAYVFVHVMPELHGAREAFSEGRKLRWEGMSIYFVALIGFLAFYALGHRRHRGEGAEGGEESHYALQLAGFALYIWLIGYLLVRSFEGTISAIALFGVAMAGHMLGINNSMRTEYRERYLASGRFVLAAMAPLGWAFGLFVAFPPGITAMLLAFVSGGVIVNSAIGELPKESGGQLWPFLLGALIYGIILLPLG